MPILKLGLNRCWVLYKGQGAALIKGWYEISIAQFLEQNELKLTAVVACKKNVNSSCYKDKQCFSAGSRIDYRK